MGYSSQKNNVLLFLAAFEKVLLVMTSGCPLVREVGAAVPNLPSICGIRPARGCRGEYPLERRIFANNKKGE